MDASTVFVRIYDSLQEIIRSTTAFDVAKGVAILWALRISFRMVRNKLKATRLRGPPRTSLIFGLAKDLFHAEDAGAMYEAWANEYGVAYEVPIMLGGSKIMLCDPRAIAHFYNKETRTYVHTDFGLIFTRKSFGMVILCAQGEEHRRQRKSLSPAFSHAAVRQLLPVFYHSAYRAKTAWESLIDANDGHNTVIDVQNWLDSIGLAGFSHDFGSLDGKTNPVADVFTTFEGSVPNSTLLLLATVFPLLTYVPTSRGDLFGDMNRTLADISRKFLERSKEEKEAGIVDGKDDKSIIGVLLKAKDSGTDVQLSVEEILAQMKLLIVAGYETTSVTMTWALLELARNPDIQTKLRAELLAFGSDPTYDQLTNNLPYLDAVVHETLRFHPPLDEFVRQAAEDDVIPLSEPVRARFGRVVNSISVTRGTRIGISTACINRSVAIWGADAKVFRPERWLEEGSIPKKAQEMQGYRHLLTFIDGPRTCLGKGFAVAEFKTVMFTLIKNFVLEMRDGPNTKIEMTMGILSRPRVVGEAGTKVPLRVRRYGS
ncbi:cytochrome P450 [Pisolithus orientalis]|uniref:cytochrome P450 n=1 Tax=Pisolithus orientalis TaxID=936130 RepID=UPI00222568A2|nr:cytochrome P450 [Pisolithus orientalis]KAI6012722.1 cytochrome P450 [Pisolithus orientalis]